MSGLYKKSPESGPTIETVAPGSNGRRFPRGSVLPGTPFEGKVGAGEIRIHKDAGKLLLGPWCYLSVSQHTLLGEARKEYLRHSKLQDLTEGKRAASPSIGNWESG